MDHHTEAHRDARGVRWLDETVRDIRYAMRSLRRSPAFTLSAAAVLALGIGSSTAIFSAVDAVLVARLPYPDDEQLVYIYMQYSPTVVAGLSAVDYRAIEAQQRSFSSVGTIIPRDVAIATGDTPRRAQIAAATTGFFSTLGVNVARGRAITPADESVRRAQCCRHRPQLRHTRVRQRRRGAGNATSPSTASRTRW